MPGVFPDYPAPIVRNASDGLVMARWGVPSSLRALLDATKKRAQNSKPRQSGRLAADGAGGRHDQYRNVGSAHWRRWLGPENCCLAPFNPFSEYDTIDGRKLPVWFAVDESRPC
jgi:putative SOS response-associated peptidase YedK